MSIWMNGLGRFAAGLAVLCGLQQLPAADPQPPTAYRELLTQQLHVAEQNQALVVKSRVGNGTEPAWLLFTSEMRAVASGPFWGDQAVTVSRSSNPKFADPLPAILDFHKQLKAAGIELWIVPVPAKIGVYPQLLSVNSRIQATERLDQAHEKFYAELQKQGIPVNDLTVPLRAAHRSDNTTQNFCRTDSHWSGTGVVVAARSLGLRVKKLAWYQPIPKKVLQTAPQTVEITGDLAILLNDKKPVKEKLALTRVFQMVDGKPTPIADDPDSPILLLGDSHTLVFHDPTLYAEGCGLADHLAEQTGIAVDVIGVRGSGANAARLNWRRRENPLAGKKLVIWCFSMREFTENTDGWRVIPVTRR